MKKIDVLCVGATSYDFMFSVEHHPQPDEKATAKSFVACGGGPAANAAVTVARMGLRAAFSGYLSLDIFGQLHLDELQTAGVNTDLVVRGNHLTPVSSAWVKPNGDRSLVNYRPAKAILPAAGIDYSEIEPKVILFDGHEPALSLELLNKARDKGIPTILDAGSLHYGTEQLYDKVSYLVCSIRFAQEITGETDAEAALAHLFACNKNIIITLGKDGLLWQTEYGSGQFSAFPITAIDTTGAGDVFHGAFAYCIAAGKAWHVTLAYSSAAAALCCTHMGARPGIPDRLQVEAFLKKQHDQL